MKRFVLFFAGVLLLGTLLGCGKDLSQESDAALGLNAQQSEGRRIYDVRCLSCHPAYSSHGGKGPGLRGMFRKKYLPSGLPANNRFVSTTIVNGRGMMPAVGDSLTPQQLSALLAYLHTL